jgi:5-formyltetrahydrofolate cyclo-ligase
MQVTNPGMNDPKAQLRRHMRSILRSHPADPRPVVAAVDGWLQTHPDASTIAVFSALPGEPDLTKLAAAHPERRWAYPRVDGQNLAFHLVRNPEDDLLAGAFGILEPSPALPQVATAEIDAFLCPGLAFDARGGRLGRGMGFYDRMLANARPDALKIGISFPFQIVADTHGQDHDIRMDQVIDGG